jgi:5'-deoxynucleotidase YfbR-like HD superfamily hydrolase
MKHLDRALALARLSLAFGRVERATFHEDGRRPETDTDHTVMLALVACDLLPLLCLELDVGLVSQFAIVHDLVEAKCGDTQTLTLDEEGRKAKALRERVALELLAQEFGETSWVVRTLRRYEEQIEPEARYVRVLDKVLPKLTHILNGCVAARGLTNRLGFAASHDLQQRKLERDYEDVARAVHDLLLDAMVASEEAWPSDPIPPPPSSVFERRLAIRAEEVVEHSCGYCGVSQMADGSYRYGAS